MNQQVRQDLLLASDAKNESEAHVSLAGWR